MQLYVVQVWAFSFTEQSEDWRDLAQESNLTFARICALYYRMTNRHVRIVKRVTTDEVVE